MTQRIATVTANFKSGYAYSGIGIDVRDNGSSNASKILLISTGTGPKLTVYKDGGLRLSSNIPSQNSYSIFYTTDIFNLDNKLTVKEYLIVEDADLSSDINTHDTAFVEKHEYIRSANGQVIINLANATTFFVESTTNTITDLQFVKPVDTHGDKDKTYSCLVMFKNVSVNTSVWSSAGVVWLDCLPPVTNSNTTFVNFHSSDSLTQVGLNDIWFGTGSTAQFDGDDGSGGDGGDINDDLLCLMIICENKLISIPMYQLTEEYEFDMTPVYTANLQSTNLTWDYNVSIPGEPEVGYNNGPVYRTDAGAKYLLNTNRFGQHRLKDSNIGFNIGSYRFFEDRIEHATNGYYLTPHTSKLDASFKLDDPYLYPINGVNDKLYMSLGNYTYNASSVILDSRSGDTLQYEQENENALIGLSFYSSFAIPYFVDSSGNKYYGYASSRDPSTVRVGWNGGSIPRLESGSIPDPDAPTASDYVTIGYTSSGYIYFGERGWSIYLSTRYYPKNTNSSNATVSSFQYSYNPVTNPGAGLKVVINTGNSRTVEYEVLSDPGVPFDYYPFLFTPVTDLSMTFPIAKYTLGTSNSPGEDIDSDNVNISINVQMNRQSYSGAPSAFFDYVYTGSGSVQFGAFTASVTQPNVRPYYNYTSYINNGGWDYLPVSSVTNATAIVTTTSGLAKFPIPTSEISYVASNGVSTLVYGAETHKPVGSTDASVGYTVSNGLKTIQSVYYGPTPGTKLQLTYRDTEGTLKVADIGSDLNAVLPYKDDSPSTRYTFPEISLMVMDVRLSRIKKFT